ncbi:hypothetical protein [uncultured Desulfuromusa sp.]|uniref:hypothetical protein n=1 Tax=uncultured Desulfuromusa sp. TaxID=219183 RepID=UPI002AA8B2C8|nr:hypothetical protein [uncultured Desulfuromusa sp.]
MTTDLHNAIETTLREAFTVAELPTCEKYPELAKKIVSPAVLIELSELSPEDDPGTGELAFTARFSAYIVLQRSSRAKLDAANLAVAVSLKIFEAGRFGQPCGPGKITRVAPDEFKPELMGYVVWVVEWTHEIRVGESIWNGEGITPTEIYLGIAPNIGLAHAEDYHLISELP